MRERFKAGIIQRKTASCWPCLSKSCPWSFWNKVSSPPLFTNIGVLVVSSSDLLPRIVGRVNFSLWETDTRFSSSEDN